MASEGQMYYASVLGLEGNEKAIKLLSKEQNLDLKEQPIAGFGKVFTNTQNTIQAPSFQSKLKKKTEERMLCDYVNFCNPFC